MKKERCSWIRFTPIVIRRICWLSCCLLQSLSIAQTWLVVFEFMLYIFSLREMLLLRGGFILWRRWKLLICCLWILLLVVLWWRLSICSSQWRIVRYGDSIKPKCVHKMWCICYLDVWSVIWIGWWLEIDWDCFGWYLMAAWPMLDPYMLLDRSSKRSEASVYILISRSNHHSSLNRSSGCSGYSVLYDNFISVHGHPYMSSLGSKAYIRLLYILVHV